MEIENDPIAQKLFNIAKIWISGNPVNATSVMDFCITLIQAVQRLVAEGEKGMYKKSLVLTTIELSIKEVPEDKLGESERKLILNILRSTLPNFIDISIKVAKGELDLGKDLGKIIAGCCFPQPQKK